MKKRKGRLKVFHSICLVSIIVFGLVAIIGSGGGGGSGGGSSSGLTYTGSETLASISDGNAQVLATGAYTNGSTGYAMSTIASLQTSGNEQTGYPLLLKVSNILTDSLEQVDFRTATDGSGSRATETVSGIVGDCGGTAAYSIEFNEGTGLFEGSFSFSNYCNQGTTITGAVTFSGTVDVNNDNALLSFSFSFVALTVSSAGDSLTLGGTLSIDTVGSPSTLTLDVFVRYNTDCNPVYWVRDYTLIVTEGSGFVDLQISGIFYNPVEGYVTVSTDTPISVNDGDDYPSSGVLIVTGNPGTAGGNTKAKLTFVSSTTYRVEADTDGDGTYDYNSSDLFWADL
jgi:hypothetical protein